MVEAAKLDIIKVPGLLEMLSTTCMNVRNSAAAMAEIISSRTIALLNLSQVSVFMARNYLEPSSSAEADQRGAHP
jgi:hypothetical protein